MSEPVCLETHARGLTLSIRAQPGARRNTVGGLHNGMLKVALTQAAEKGKANAALIDLLAKTLGLSKSQIELVTGETSRQKRLLITTASSEETERVRQAVSRLVM